jgi:hypothetical protein
MATDPHFSGLLAQLALALRVRQRMPGPLKEAHPGEPQRRVVFTAALLAKTCL